MEQIILSLEAECADAWDKLDAFELEYGFQAEPTVIQRARWATLHSVLSRFLPEKYPEF